jgi:hypothetical protein
MKYRELKNYKYQLVQDFEIMIPLKPGSHIETLFISLTVYGLLKIKNGYAWDGASGPAIDTKNFMIGSLVHDVLFQLIGMRYLKRSDIKTANQILRDVCIMSGMSKLRAWWVYSAVQIFGPLCINENDRDTTPTIEV